MTADLLTPYPHIEALAVRWADMDVLGHVNNAKYLTYIESARMGYFERIELASHRDAAGQGPALVTTTCNFRRQVRFPAELRVGVRVVRIGGKSFSFEYLILDSEGQTVADATAVIAWVDYEAEKAIPLPEGLCAAIEALEGRSLRD